MTTKRCGAYLRVSTVRQARDGESLDSQMARIKKMIEVKSTEEEQWNLTDVYREEGASAKEGSIGSGRKEFARLLGDVRAGRIDTVIVTKLDRLTRSVRDFYDIWSIFEKAGVELVSLGDNFDTCTAMGRAMLKIIVLFAELERELIGERTKTVMDDRAAQGFWNGSRVLGFRADTDGILVPQEEEPKLVQLMFEKCKRLRSAGAVLSFLNEHGYRMPKYQTKGGAQRGGGRFNKQTVINILTNPVYIGKIRYRDEVFDGKHKPVIKPALFNEVQKILEHNRETRRGRKLADHIYLLKGLVRDGRCGRMMTPYSSGGGKRQHYYYKCTARVNQGEAACPTKYVPADGLEVLVLDFLKKMSLDKPYIDRIVSEANGRASESLGNVRQEEAEVGRNLASVNKELQNLVRSVAVGGDKKFRSLQEEMERLETDRDALETKLTRVRSEKDKLEQHVVSAEVLIQSLRQFSQIIESADREQLQAIIPQVVEVVEWHEDQKEPGTGEARIALFEEFQPDNVERLEPIEWKRGELNTRTRCASRSQGWLPERNSLRTAAGGSPAPKSGSGLYT